MKISINMCFSILFIATAIESLMFAIANGFGSQAVTTTVYICSISSMVGTFINLIIHFIRLRKLKSGTSSASQSNKL